MMTTPLTVILDLDETLVHTTDRPLPIKSTAAHIIRLDGHNMYVHIRPGARQLLQFLKRLHPFVRLAVWTAGIKLYAARVLDLLMPEWRTHLYFVRSRGDCVSRRVNNRESALLKDLRHLGIPAHRLILVDDNDDHYRFNVNNGYRVLRAPPFRGELSDRYLSTLRRELTRRVQLV
mgnify:CR=1 FL=1